MSHLVEITTNALAEIRHHGTQDFPYECCGFLFGKEGDFRRITLAKRAQNIQVGDKRRRFVIDPQEYMQAERFALTEGLDLLGIYHSHPNHPAIPSIHDLKQAVPFFSYLIISVLNGQPATVLSWRLSEDGTEMKEETLILASEDNEQFKSLRSA